MQTQIKLLLEQQPDRGLHCLLFHLHHLEVNTKVEPLTLNFRVLAVKLVCVRKFRNFTVTNIQTSRFIPPTDADRIADSEDHDQLALHI